MRYREIRYEDSWEIYNLECFRNKTNYWKSKMKTLEKSETYVKSQ